MKNEYAEKKKESDKQYYQKNREKLIAYQKEYKFDNPEKIRENQKKIRDKSKRKKYMKEYMKGYINSFNGKKIMKKHRRLRKAKINQINETYTQEEWEQKVKQTNGFCPSCNIFVGIDNLTIDHIYPVSKAEKDGIYTINDVQPLCFTCNTSKYNKILIEIR